jgi:hypothetical protein
VRPLALQLVNPSVSLVPSCIVLQLAVGCQALRAMQRTDYAAVQQWHAGSVQHFIIAMKRIDCLWHALQAS